VNKKPKSSLQELQTAKPEQPVPGQLLSASCAPPLNLQSRLSATIYAAIRADFQAKWACRAEAIRSDGRCHPALDQRSTADASAA
jgi:hypothetical protein